MSEPQQPQQPPQNPEETSPANEAQSETPSSGAPPATPPPEPSAAEGAVGASAAPEARPDADTPLAGTGETPVPPGEEAPATPMDAPAATPSATTFNGPDFSAAEAPRETASLELLDDVELDVKVELGRAEMYIEDVLKLGVGSVVELNRLAGDPVDVYVNDRLVARGEVLVLDDNFCVRINDIIGPVAEPERAE